MSVVANANVARTALAGLLRNTKYRSARQLYSVASGKQNLQARRKSYKLTNLSRSPAVIGAGALSKSVVTQADTAQNAPWLIVGLGNPGARYNGTRHNVGFQVLDTLASKLGVSLNRAQDKALQARGELAGKQVILAKPITFMNVSGEAVGKLSRYYKVPTQQILVVYDDLDLPLGKVRLRGKGGHGGHNGMRSITQHLSGSQDFPRIKIGIGRPAGQLPVAAFVLQAFNKAEALEINIAAQECCDIIQSVLAVGLEKALSGVRA